ncbi:MAG: polysaccharide deacetylase family protein, partial [Solirubrobacterales bacterium]|nr:polysaccharide deacetylase family protein [Solirubrobacterales bacterium]
MSADTPARRPVLSAQPSSAPLLLCYHAVSSDWPAALAVSPDQLRDHVAVLAARGYRGVTFHAAASDQAGPGAVAITFDDAMRSVLDAAFPILRAAGFPATVFAPTDFIGSSRPMTWPGVESWLDGPHRDELNALSWDELRALSAAGWEIGSHTRSHPRLTEIDSSTLDSELRGSLAEIEARLDAPCRSLAYPYGAYDARVVDAAARAGYAAAAGTMPGRMHPPTSTLDWSRLPINRVDGRRRFALKTSRTARRLKGTPAWG